MPSDKEFDDALVNPVEPMIRFRITNDPEPGDGVWEFNNAASDDAEWHEFGSGEKYKFIGSDGIEVSTDNESGDTTITFKKILIPEVNALTMVSVDGNTIKGTGTEKTPLYVDTSKLVFSISNISGLSSILDSKQNTEAGKGLSTNDFTNAYKNKLDSFTVTSLTAQGNVFNGPNQLVKLDNQGRLPAIDGSLLKNIAAVGGSGGSSGNQSTIELDNTASIVYLNSTTSNHFVLKPTVEVSVEIAGEWMDLDEVLLVIYNGLNYVSFNTEWVWLNTKNNTAPLLADNGYDIIKITKVNNDFLCQHVLQRVN